MFDPTYDIKSCLFFMQLTMKSDLRKQFGLDNLDMTDIIFTLERTFLVRISQSTAPFDVPLDIVDEICTLLGI